MRAATFGWLCVETLPACCAPFPVLAATFGWLCVETLNINLALDSVQLQPPSGGCVLKRLNLILRQDCGNAATFGWLCVETSS